MSKTSTPSPAATNSVATPKNEARKPDARFVHSSISAAIFVHDVQPKDGQAYQTQQIDLRRSYYDEKSKQYKTTHLNVPARK